jgi:hypothetical protein
MRIVRKSADGVIPILNTSRTYCIQIENRFYPIVQQEGEFYGCLVNSSFYDGRYSYGFARAHTCGAASLQRSVEHHYDLVNNSDTFMLEFDSMQECLAYIMEHGDIPERDGSA